MHFKFINYKKIIFYLIAAVVQLALLAGFALWGLVNAPVQWEWGTTIAVLPTDNNHEIKIYGYLPKRSRYTELLQNTPYAGYSSVNDSYLHSYLSAVSIEFVKEHGKDIQTQHEVIIKRDDLFCYRIYDDVKGASWRVWVSTPTGQVPQIAVQRQSEVTS